MTKEKYIFLASTGIGILFLILGIKLKDMSRGFVIGGFVMGGILFLIGLVGMFIPSRMKKVENRIVSYQKRNGKFPSLPKELLDIAPDYKEGQLMYGQPITKDMMIINPSIQFLRGLSFNQKLVEFLFDLLIWLGKDPREYVGSVMGTPIIWSADSQEWVKDFVSHWKKIIENGKGNKFYLISKRKSDFNSKENK